MSWVVDPHTNPYRCIGLLANPFAWVDGADPGPTMTRAVVSDVDLQPGQGRCIELIGVRGAGKTTQLRSWQLVQPGPYHYVPAAPRRHRFAPPPVSPLVYWDEADRMPRPVLRRGLRRLARAGSTLVVGTHRSLADEAQRVGLSILSVEFGPLDQDELARWADERIARVALSATPPAVPERVLARIANASAGSLRVAGDLLHAWIAQLAQGAANSAHLGTVPEHAGFTTRF